MKTLAYLLSLLLGATGSSASWIGAGQAPPSHPRPAQRTAQGPQPVRLAPKFNPGNVLRYQMEFRTITEGHRTGLVQDPQAPTKLEFTWAAVLRIEVLTVEAPASPSAPGGLTRLRATYERSVSTARSDTYDPQGASLEAEYQKLQGRSVEFTLDADGKVQDVSGLQEILNDEQAATSAREWLGQLALGATLPREGIVPGQKWSSELPATSAPIAGLLWRSESTYLRDERCRPPEGAGIPSEGSLGRETCAVILTRFEIAQPHPPRDPTPDDYRRRGLRTAGKWGGSGEGLSYVSLRTGWVVSITQSSTEEMDVTVSTADGSSGVRYAGHVRSESQVTLLPEAPPAPR